MAQDSLPKFVMHYIGKGKAQISWINPFENCIQLSIQRSYDSTKFFQTIFTAQSPNLPQNGFVDNNALEGIKVYYRIFYVLEGGNYFFTKSKPRNAHAQPDKVVVITPAQIKVNTDTIVIKHIQKIAIEKPAEKKIEKPIERPVEKPIEKKFISLYNANKDTLLEVLEYPDYKKFKDSINSKTKDTLLVLNATEVLLKHFIPKYVWKPSQYIFTNNNGNITIYLPAIKQHRYKIIFFEATGTEIFQIKPLKDDSLILDKTNFLHEGWFHFELFEDDKLKEKNKFFLEKEF